MNVKNAQRGIIYKILNALFFLISIGFIFVSCKSVNSNFSSQNSVIKTDTIFSKSLNEKRVISIYLPQNFSNKKDYAIVYCADGQKVLPIYKMGLDSLIRNKITPEFILIGINSNDKKVDENSEIRNYEYLKYMSKNTDKFDLKSRFKNHLNYFTQEVPKYLREKYQISNKNERRIFYLAIPRKKQVDQWECLILLDI